MKSWLGWAIGGVVAALLATGFLWFRERDRRLRLEGANEYLLKDLTARDSTIMASLGALNAKLNMAVSDVDTVTLLWKNTVEKVQVPGSVDSVYKDSAFAALPDSAKNRILRQLGSDLERKCSVLAVTCQQFRDSANAALTIKDEIISSWKTRYENKPRRACGVGALLGGSTGYDVLHKQWYVGPGLSGGLACTF